VTIESETQAALHWLGFTILRPLSASFQALVVNATFFGPSLNPQCLCKDV
jgi:hypothetical protein